MTGIVDRYPHPSLLVDAEGRVVQCNRAVIAPSLPSAGLCMEGERLAAATAVDRAALREAIRDVAKAARDGGDTTRAVTLSVPSGQHAAVVSIYAAGKVFRRNGRDRRTGSRHHEKSAHRARHSYVFLRQAVRVKSCPGTGERDDHYRPFARRYGPETCTFRRTQPAAISSRYSRRPIRMARWNSFTSTPEVASTATRCH